MKTFLFILLAGYAVRCDDSNYYVVQMPDNDILRTKDFRVYWNVPTMQCKSKKILFDDLYEKYGILQNTGDTFRGDRISILYDPGDFPALLRNSSSGEIKYRNGGVPQEGDLIKHLDTFQKVLEQSVPDKNFNGVGIIDFESWKPVLRQNFGILTPYKDVSYEIEKKRHWWWKKQWIQEEAKRRFEGAGREFMQATVSLAKKMRPHAVWGYYGFPYCYNMAYNNRKEACADKVPQENDGTGWLWQESTALYPSVYSSDDITANQLAGLIRGRVKEAARVASRGAPILPYFWYRYRDKGYFNKSDLDVAFSTLFKSNASGFIIWGGSNDVNTIDKCIKLKQYITDTLGPAVAKYTKRNMRLGDDSDDPFIGIYNPNNASKYDPEYTWIPPVNYTQKIEEMVDKELKEEKDVAKAHKKHNESILVDMILHKIANYCVEGCDNKSKGKRTDEKEVDAGVNESRLVLVTEDPFKKNYSEIAVTEPTNTEDDTYDYDLNTGDAAEVDIYETTAFVDISTTSKNIEKSSTTMKSIEEISKITTSSDETSTELGIREKENSTSNNISKEQNSIVDVSKEESSTIALETTEANENNNNRLIIEEINVIDLSTDETNSTEDSTTETSTTTISTTELSINDTSTTESTTTISTKELSINDTSTTESTTSIGSEKNSILKNEMSLDKNSTGSNSIEVDFIDVSTEESSIIYPSTEYDSPTVNEIPKVEQYAVVSDTTDEPNAIDSDTTDEPSAVDDGITEESSAVGTKSDSSTTLAPVLTEQVLGSVSRAIVSKPVACSLFYLYSISKCLCVLLGNC